MSKAPKEIKIDVIPQLAGITVELGEGTINRLVDGISAQNRKDFLAEYFRRMDEQKPTTGPVHFNVDPGTILINPEAFVPSWRRGSSEPELRNENLETAEPFKFDADNIDAAYWAKEFTNLFWMHWKGTNSVFLQTEEARRNDLEGLMICWFANAIESGRRNGPTTTKFVETPNEWWIQNGKVRGAVPHRAPKPFEIQVDDEKVGMGRIEQAVFQAIGAASTCWENMNETGLFQDQEAKEIGLKLAAFIEEEFQGFLDKDQPWQDVRGTADPELIAGINALVKQSGENSRDHGFHDDIPDLADYAQTERGHIAYERALTNFWISKLDLIHEEVSEALGELRSGHAPEEVYYLSENGGFHREQMYEDGVPVLKPEGFGIEIADAIIREADLAFLTGVDLAKCIEIKAEYNRTRPYKHGRQL